MAERVLHLGHQLHSHSDTALVADLTFDRERVLQAAKRVIELVQKLVGLAKGVQRLGPLFIVSKLDGQRQGAGQVVQADLGVTALELHPTHVLQRVHILRITRQQFLVICCGLVQHGEIFVENGESAFHIWVVGQHLGQVFVGVDRLRIISVHLRVLG